MAIECYRFTIQGISTGEQCQNVHHFNCDNNDDANPRTVAGELVQKWHTSFKAKWLAFNSNRYGIRYVECKKILVGGGNSYWREYPEGTDVGAIDSEQVPLQTAPIAKIFGGLTENRQGRMFLPAPPESLLVANVLDSSYTTDVLDYFDDLISFSGTSHDFTLSLYSRSAGNAVSATTVTMSNIIGMLKKRHEPL